MFVGVQLFIWLPLNVPSQPWQSWWFAFRHGGGVTSARRRRWWHILSAQSFCWKAAQKKLPFLKQPTSISSNNRPSEKLAVYFDGGGWLRWAAPWLQDTPPLKDLLARTSPWNFLICSDHLVNGYPNCSWLLTIRPAQLTTCIWPIFLQGRSWVWSYRSYPTSKTSLLNESRDSVDVLDNLPPEKKGCLEDDGFQPCMFRGWSFGKKNHGLDDMFWDREANLPSTKSTMQVTYHCPQSSSWRQIGRSSRCANMAMFEREPPPGVTQAPSKKGESQSGTCWWKKPQTTTWHVWNPWYITG